jgi:hypothetical protein
VSVRDWIIRNVPCTQGPVPEEWVNAIYIKLIQSNVEPAVVSAGLALARKAGYVFDDGTFPSDIVFKGPPQPTIGVPSQSPKQMRQSAAEMLEWQFENAQAVGNYSEMRRIAKQFANLLNSFDPDSVSDEEMQWGAPMLRRAVRRNVDGSDTVPRRVGGRGGLYRPLYEPVDIMEGEGEGEGEAE